MKRNVLLLGLASLMLAFTGCAKDDLADGQVGGNTTPEATSGVLVASIAQDPATRLAMGEGNMATWSEGDQIAVFSTYKPDHKIAFNLTPESVGQNSATFVVNDGDAERWNNLEIFASSVPYNKSQQVVAVFPYETTYIDAPSMDYTQLARIGAAIPETQQYVEGSFDPKALPMIAMTTRTEGTFGQDTFEPMTFIHLGALVKLQLFGAEEYTLDHITVSASMIAGTSVIDFNEWMDDIVDQALCGTGESRSLGAYNYSSFRMDGNGSDMITLNGPITVGTEPTPVYIAISPAGHTSLTFTFYKTGDEAPVSRTVILPNPVEAGDLLTLAPLSLESGEAPVLNVEGSTVSWEAPANVKGYSYRLYEGENYVGGDELAADVTSLDVNSLTLYLPAGQHELTFKLGVEYTNASPAQTQTTVTYTSQGYAPGVSYSEASNAVVISNWSVGEWETVEYAYVEGLNKTEADFAAAEFKTTDSGSISCADLAYGDYTFCVRCKTAGAEGYTYGYVNVTLKDPLDTDVVIDVRMEGNVMYITVSKGQDLVQNALDSWTLNLSVSGTPVGGFDGTWYAENVLRLDLTDALHFGDIGVGMHTIELGYYSYGDGSVHIFSNAVTVTIG